MATVTIHEAKTHLSRLIKDALAGNDVTIAEGRSGQDPLRLTPVKPLIKKRQLGWLAHELAPGVPSVPDSFWEPLPDDELSLWNGASLPDDPVQ